MKVTYGYTVQDRNDYFLVLAQRMADMFSIVTTPGLFLVDAFPWCERFELLVSGSQLCKLTLVVQQ